MRLRGGWESSMGRVWGVEGKIGGSIFIGVVWFSLAWVWRGVTFVRIWVRLGGLGGSFGRGKNRGFVVHESIGSKSPIFFLSV